MARINGKDRKIGFKIGSTHGTAVQAGAGDGMTCTDFTWSENAEEVRNESLGLGLLFPDDIQRGVVRPGGTITGNSTYSCAWLPLIAAFFSSDSVSQPNADLYRHVMTPSFAAKEFGTLAAELTTAKVLEFVSAYPVGLTINAAQTPGYLQFAVDWIADQLELATSVNTNANLAATTQTDSEYIYVQQDDDFWINSQSGGAVSSSDQLNIANWNLRLTKGLEMLSEIAGALGLQPPRFTEGFLGTLTVTRNGVDDATYFEAAQDGDEFKCKLAVTGTSSTTDSKAIEIYIPRMKLISNPDHPMSDPGESPATLTFQIMQASANPTGMDAAVPYIHLWNGTSGAYL